MNENKKLFLITKNLYFLDKELWRLMVEKNVKVFNTLNPYT